MNPQVLVLAGGVGKRFWPLATSKPLLGFSGVPLLVHNLQQLKQAGFRHAVIVASAEDEPTIKTFDIPGFMIDTVAQSSPRGMADAVLTAVPKLTLDPLLIMNATDLVEPSLYQAMFRQLSAGKSFMVAKRVDTYFPGGYLKMSGDTVEAIVEKPGSGNEPSDLVNLVFNGLQQPHTFIDILKNSSSPKDDVYEVALTELLQQQKLTLITYEGKWHATKYPWDILKMMDYFFETTQPSIASSASISPQATIVGNVVISQGVRVFENAVIKGPAYIGKDTIVGNGALIRHAMIGEKCVIGYNTEVARSYIGNNCWFHSNYIGDSVIEHNVSLGGGSILANLRLDEVEITSVVNGKTLATGTNKLGAIIGSNVRIGVNINCMPGVKIGSNSLIGAGLTIAEDIPEKSFVKAQTKLDIVTNIRDLDPTNREKFKTKL